MASNKKQTEKSVPVTEAVPAELAEPVSGTAGWNREAVMEPEAEDRDIFKLLEDDIKCSDLPKDEKTERLAKLMALRAKKVHILLVGATGAGKSSTINALFNMELATIGVGVDPQTDSISSYTLGNLII